MLSGVLIDIGGLRASQELEVLSLEAELPWSVPAVGYASMLARFYGS
jgi:hypothetical protein